MVTLLTQARLGWAGRMRNVNQCGVLIPHLSRMNVRPKHHRLQGRNVVKSAFVERTKRLKPGRAIIASRNRSSEHRRTRDGKKEKKEEHQTA
jgi:hypothetical protein